MTTVEMVMPAMGESVMEGTILQWLKQEGDAIEQEEPLLEVATDKVDTEEPATHSGTLQKILVPEGTVVEVGKPIAVIAQEGSSAGEKSNGNGATQENQAEEEIAEEALRAVASPGEPAPSPTSPPTESSGRFYSPLVMSIAREEGIPETELAQIPGTGKEGRLTKKDLLSYLKTERKSTPTNGQTDPAETLSSAPQPGSPKFVSDEVIEMDRMRKMIATRMVASKQDFGARDFFCGSRRYGTRALAQPHERFVSRTGRRKAHLYANVRRSHCQGH